MKRALVVTVGAKQESLGALKAAAWLRRTGYEVKEVNKVDTQDTGYDLYLFSCIFSWKLPLLVEMVNRVKGFGEVWIGGPAVTMNRECSNYVILHTGIVPDTGIDQRFETEPGSYPMVYFSRGCPAYTPACGLCPVPRIKGNQFRYYRNAQPAKFLLDNNLSALPDDYQDYIIRRYTENWTGGRVDANSGFEPHTFTAKTYERWSKFPLMCWRFGYDDITEREQALEMMRVLKHYGLSGERVRVYTIIGNEAPEVCMQRCQEVIDHGFHPWPQRLRPLNWIEGPLPTRSDWDEPTLIALQRFYGIAAFWKKLDPKEFYYQSRFPLREIRERFEWCQEF